MNFKLNLEENLNKKKMAGIIISKDEKIKKKVRRHNTEIEEGSEGLVKKIK